MVYPAIILSMNFELDVYKSFKYFSNLIICDDLIMNLYKFKSKTIKIYSKTFLKLLKRRLPKI